MNPVLIGVVGVVAIVAIAIIAFRFSKSMEFGGFRDWVKNPLYRQAAEDYFAARSALRVPDDISDDEIRRMVDRLFVQKDEDFNFRRLELVGAKAVPFLVEALEKPGTARTKFRDRGHATAAESPFERIVDLIAPIGPAEAAGALARYVEHEDNHFRKYAAFALGHIGTAACAAPMLKALDDDDDYVRSFAMMGIERGIKAGRCQPDFLDAMFPAVVELLTREDSSVGGGPPGLLLMIDTDRALPILLSSEYFTLGNRQLHYIIEALNEAGHKIPPEILLPFLQAVRPLVGKYPHQYQYAAALTAYAANPDAAADETFRAALTSPERTIKEAAAAALAKLSGVSNPYQVASDALRERGFEALSTPRKHYLAVFLYDGDVRNGGHAQYFVNSYSDHWKEALEGLGAIGARARADILRRAIELFGPQEPSENRNTRHRQIARFSRRQNAALDALDKEYYACDENVEAMLKLYAIDHSDEFSSSSSEVSLSDGDHD